jgi:hypothetical protein
LKPCSSRNQHQPIDRHEIISVFAGAPDSHHFRCTFARSSNGWGL